MKGKILITGGTGFVAGHILKQLKQDYEVYVISREEKPVDLPLTNIKWLTLKGRNWEEWGKAVSELAPTAIIHTSAIADIDQCEKDRETAYSVNVKLTETLVKASEKCNSRFIFCSSDTVFDGKKGMYKEDDIPVPVNYYAETKISAEKAVLNANIPKVVARISLVMGFPAFRTVGNSFIARMEQKMQKGEPIPMPKDEYRTPIDVITLSEALIELAVSSNYDGILHLAGNERISRYDMATKICKEMGWDESYITPTIIDNPNRAPRPKDASLDNSKAMKILKTRFLNVEEGIKRVKEDYLKNR